MTMNGLQALHDNQQQHQINPIRQQQANLNQMYGYDADLEDEQKKEWWQNFLQFLRESKDRDMQKYRQQMV